MQDGRSMTDSSRPHGGRSCFSPIGSVGGLLCSMIDSSRPHGVVSFVFCSLVCSMNVVVNFRCGVDFAAMSIKLRASCTLRGLLTRRCVMYDCLHVASSENVVSHETTCWSLSLCGQVLHFECFVDFGVWCPLRMHFVGTAWVYQK